MSLHPVRLLMLLAAVAAPRTIAVETGRIEGHVRNATSGTPIANAQVVVVGTSLTAVTSDSGFYAIANVPVGTYTVRAQFIGYKPADSSGVRVAANQTVTVDLRLQLSPVMLTGIVVTGAPSPAAERLSVSSSSVTINGVMARQRGAARADVGRGYPPQTPEPWRYQGQPGNREQYDEIVENPFVAVSVDPLSTFSIDVDRASYSNVRRFIMQEGQLPPPDAVRIDLQARRVHLENLPPSNFVFLLDVSGSMMDENKLPLVKAAMRLLVNELRPKDHVAIVVYAGSAGLVLPSTAGTEKDKILDAIGRLEAGGSTAGGAGIRRAYDEAVANFIRGGNNRVILATDGD